MFNEELGLKRVNTLKENFSVLIFTTEDTFTST